MNGSFLIPAGVIGPASSTANAIATFSGTTGQFLLNNSVTISAGSITATQAILTGALNAVNVAAGVTPFVEFEVDSTLTTSPRGIMTAQFNTGTDGARLHMRKARGTRASPTVVVTGDNLGRIVGTGYDGSNYLEMASIYFATEGTIAATRVPTNIQFWTATNAAPSVLTLASQINSSQQFLNNVGTTAAPSYSFTGQTTVGMYAPTATSIGFALSASQQSVLFNYNSGNTQIFGAGQQASLTFTTAGALSIAAAGTNQSITLTPSGTGNVALVLGSSGQLTVTNTTAGNPAALVNVTGANNSGVQYRIGNNLAAATFGVEGTAGDATISTGSSATTNIRFQTNNGTERARFAGSTGNLLLGGLTTDGTGVLQFPAGASDATSGITFAAAINAFAANTGQFNFQTSATSMDLRVRTAGGRNIDIQSADSNTASILDSGYSSSGNFNIGTGTANRSLVFVSGAGVTALTLDSSQNATFVGTLKSTASANLNLQGNGNGTGVQISNVTYTNSSGAQAAVTINPVYNQTSTAAATDLLINRTQTAVGSGAQLLVDFQVGSTSKFNIDNTGVVTMTGSLNSSANIVAGASSGIRWTASSYMAAPSNGIITLLNSANNDFTRLQFGGTTSSFPALARSATTLTVQLADGTAGGNLGLGGTITTYNNIATAGNGVVSVQGAARATAQTGANASVATYTVGASDASFEVSANILVTTATTHAFTCTCAYTDEGNTARTITFTFSNVGGTLLTSIANTGGTVPYEGVPLHIRAKASTSITIATTGTFTSVVYNVEGNIRKIA